MATSSSVNPRASWAGGGVGSSHLHVDVQRPDAQVEHEASTSKIGEDQIFYLKQRGLNTEHAISVVVNGFAKEVFKELPMEFAVEAQKLLADKDIVAYVVSMPCLEWFEAQPKEYRDAVLPPDVSARVAVEAGIAQGWWKYLGTDGRAVSLEHFGASADAATLFREFGITAEAVVAAARESLAAVSA